MFDFSEKMFNVSDINYVYRAGRHNIQLYMCLAHIGNFIVDVLKVIKIVLWNVDTLPYFIVWMTAVMFWFFSEMAVEVANFFNIKHSSQYSSSSIKYFRILTASIKFYFNSKKKQQISKLSYSVVL